jgi:hypothetical protein
MVKHSVVFFSAAMMAGVVSMGCSASSEGSQSSVAADKAAGPSADGDCRIVLREAASSTLHGGEVYTEPSGVSYVVFRGVIDVDSQLVAGGASVSVWYQGDNNAGQTVQATPCTTDCEQGLDYLNGGASPPPGFTRFSFATQDHTVEAGTDGEYSLQLIPFATDSSGNVLYDHNRASGNYQLGRPTYAVKDDFLVCPVPDPQGLVATSASGSGSGGSSSNNLPTVTTGVGNTINVSIAQTASDDDGTSYTNAYALNVAYDDLANYCNLGVGSGGGGEVPGPAYINAWAIINTENVQAGTASQDTRSFSLHVETTGDFKTYTNDGSDASIGPIKITMSGTRGVSDVKLHSVDFAFQCVGRYDSNSGQNYDVPLGDLP